MNDARRVTSGMTGHSMPAARKRAEALLVALFLAAILAVGFSPAIFGGRTLLQASWDIPSVMSTGAYDLSPRPSLRLPRTPDPGAPAWQTEPWFRLIGEQYWSEFNLPLWNPYNGYGTPLLADAISQPFFPLATLLSLNVTPWTYNLFIIGRLFIAGMLMFFFARQFLTALPSLFSAVTFMLTGYFITYLDIAHLSVEVLTPGIFLAIELLARKNSWSAAAGAAIMILLANSGGMPESLFLILSFGCLYFICRVLFTPELRSRAGALAAKFVTAVILGFALSSFLLLPFFEFLRLAFDVHQPSNVGGVQGGLAADQNYSLMVQYLLPLILGPVLNSILSAIPAWSGLRGYWGIIPFFFGVLAVLVMFSRRRMAGCHTERFLTIFFAVTLVLMILKRFGSVLVNWVGALPLAEMVVFPKYQEPLIAFCVAMLGALGFAALVERRTTQARLIAAAAVTLGTLLGFAALHLSAVRGLPRRVVPFHGLALDVSVFYYASIACGVALLILVTAMAWLAVRASGGARPRLLQGAIVLLSLELLFNFIVPSFYLLGSLPPLKADPYRGAPYIDFLHATNSDHSRIFAREEFLFPNWSSVFGLADVRHLDALYYERYRRFMRSFLLPSGDTRVHGDLSDRFTGSEFRYEFDTETERRFLALSSIKYLITNSEYGWPSRWLDEIVEQHKGETILGFGLHTFRFGTPVEKNIRGLLQYPPSNRVSYKIFIDPEKPVFEATVVLSESLAVSDGMGFKLEIRDGQTVQTLFEAHIDPRNVPADREGRPVCVDLRRYAGREVELLFSTDPGPRGDVLGDFGGWVGLRFTTENRAPITTDFKKLYDGEVRVYESPNALPRAALFPAVEILFDDAVLARLKDPAFNPWEKAVVSRASVSARRDLAALAEAAPAAPSAARIVRYQSQYVAIEAETPAPALLVLNDTNYPGWRAYLNGEPAEMLTANFLFRGVLLPPGKHLVEFKYQPRSFQIGGGISIAAFAILAILAFRERRARSASSHLA